MIIYLIIIGDVLCGVAPDYNGLVTNFLGVHDPSVFYASRPFVVSGEPHQKTCLLHCTHAREVALVIRVTVVPRAMPTAASAAATCTPGTSFIIFTSLVSWRESIGIKLGILLQHAARCEPCIPPCQPPHHHTHTHTKHLPLLPPLQMAVMCAAGLAPLVSLRDLRRLAPMSFIAVAVAGAFVFSLVGLGGLAITTGQVSNFKWLPTKKMLGPTPGAIAIHLLAVLPVITMSFVCHYNLLPVARNLERFTERRIMMVIRRALSICTALFTAVAASGVVLFGSHTQDNILLNLSPEALARLLPATPAVMLCFAIRLGYCVCLMVSCFAPLHVLRMLREGHC